MKKKNEINESNKIYLSIYLSNQIFLYKIIYIKEDSYLANINAVYSNMLKIQIIQYAHIYLIYATLIKYPRMETSLYFISYH